MPDAIPEIHTYKGYHIYFWSHEGEPLEPIHVHISKGRPIENSTKYWLNSDGTITLDSNDSHIPLKELRKIEGIIRQYYDDIVKRWEDYFKTKAQYHDDALGDGDISDGFGGR